MTSSNHHGSAGPTRRATLAAAAAAALAARTSRAAVPDPIATTAHGRLRGAVDGGVCVFRGIPYAGDVAGAQHRFKPPPPPPSWTGVRDATRFGAPSIQPGGSPGEPAPAENCLFLNVWTPAPDRGRRPVMFYSHGGGFTIGSGARPGQNGANLARLHNVVVVESNHRLGALGYLYLGELLGPEYPGNQGLQDIAAALRWVGGSIAGFGGDPDNVMIFGESGGGGKTACLYTMPSAAPYFAKASIESPIGPGARTPAEATAVARDAVRALGLADARGLLDVPAAQLLRFQTGEAGSAVPGARSGGKLANQRDQLFWPFIDGHILPQSPFLTQAPAISADKPLIIGGCKDEAVFFNMGDPSAFNLAEQDLHARLAAGLGSRADAWIATFRRSRPGDTPSQLYMAIATAAPWRAHAVHIAEEKARQCAAPVFSYILQYQSPYAIPGTSYPAGSPHASDIGTKFDNVPASAPPGPGSFFTEATENKRKTAANMSGFWASFAHTSRPHVAGQPDWAPYTLATRQTMLIDAECRLVSDPEGEERRFWQNEPDPERVR